MKNFTENYEKKSAEVKGEPFLLEDSGCERMLSQLCASAESIAKNNYSPEKVRKILIASLKEHCVKIGYTFDEGEEKYQTNERGDMMVTCILKKSLASRGRSWQGREKQPGLKQIFKGA